MKKIFLTLCLIFSMGYLSLLSSCEDEEKKEDVSLYVGGAARTFSYTEFESWNDLDGNGYYDSDESFNDWGEDRVPSENEEGYEPVVNPDPARDDFDAVVNFSGSENNEVFEYIVIGGYKICLDTFPVNCRLAQDSVGDLSVRAATFHWRNETFMLVVFDLLLVPHIYINPLKRKIAEATGISYERIAVVTTGNREAPDVSGFWSGKILTRWLTDTIMPLAYEAALESVASMQKARLVTVKTQMPSCIGKDDGSFKKAEDCLMPLYDDWHYSTVVTDPIYDIPLLIKDERDPIDADDTLIAVQARSEKNGQAIVTLINYSAIPDSMGKNGNLIGPDYPGYLVEAIEASAGGTAIYLPRAAGGAMSSSQAFVPYRDAAGNPSTGLELLREAADGTVESVDVGQTGLAFPQVAPEQDLIYEASMAKARSLGYFLSEQTLVALETADYVSPVTMEVIVEDHDVIIIYSTFMDYLSSLKLDPNFDPLDSYISLSYCLEAEFGCLRTLIQVVFLGDLQLVTVPGEVAADYIKGRPVISAQYSSFTNDQSPCVYGTNRFPDEDFNRITALESLAYKPADDADSFKVMPIGNANTRIGILLPATDLQGEFCHPNYFEEVYLPSLQWGDSVMTHIGMMMNATFRYSSALYYPWESSIFGGGYNQEPY